MTNLGPSHPNRDPREIEREEEAAWRRTVGKYLVGPQDDPRPAEVIERECVEEEEEGGEGGKRRWVYAGPPDHRPHWKSWMTADGSLPPERPFDVGQRETLRAQFLRARMKLLERQFWIDNKLRGNLRVLQWIDGHP